MRTEKQEQLIEKVADVPVTDERVLALHRYHIVQTPSEIFFRHVAETASTAFNCKLSIVSFIDEREVFYKEVVVRNSSLPDFTGATIPHTLSPCAFAIRYDDVTVIDCYPPPDSPSWEAYNTQVTKFGLRFYAGVPIRTSDGFNIGMFAIVDLEPRVFTAQDKALLKSFARILMDQLERRLTALNEIEQQKRANMIIADQNNLITALNSELRKINSTLKEVNEQLVTSVSDKSKKLITAKKALVASYKEMDALVYNASHGLKSPITTIEGLIHVALLEINEGKAVDYLRRIESFTKRMKGTVDKLHMIHDIINYPDDTSFDIVRLDEDDMKRLISGVISVFQSQLSEQRIIVTVSLSDNIIFVGIRAYLQYIFFNLFENAVTFSADRTSFPQPSQSKIEVEIKDHPDHIVLSVYDNGEGIAESCHDKIFTMFFRGGLKSGPGLGLYIVKKVVSKMNGSVTFQSVQGEYSFFEVKLPKCSNEIQGPQQNI
jgi:signal transduction histidine kinase